MKKITLLLLLVCNSVFSEDNSTCDYVEDYPEQASDKELEKNPVDVFMTQWNNKLNKYLLSQNDPYLNFMALLAIDNSFGSSDGLINIQDLNIKNQIDSLLLDDQLLPETINLMLTFCQNHDAKSVCDIDKMMNKRIDTSPENMLVYIEPLQKALDDEDYELSRLILSTMASKNQVNAHYYLKSSFNDAIQTFAKENPVPESVLIQGFEQFEQAMGFSGKKIDEIKTNMEKYFIWTTTITYKFMIPTINISPLMTACELDMGQTEECLIIAEKLASEGKTIIERVVGHNLLETIYSQQNNIKKLEQATKAKLLFRTQYECIAKSMSSLDPLDNLWDIELFNLTQIIEQQKGEYEALKESAWWIYQRNQKQGKTDVPNPKLCF